MTSHHNVGFHSHTNKEEYQEERKKYLTAKYPQHQMRLIRKRLEVEDWVDTQLRALYDVVSFTICFWKCWGMTMVQTFECVENRHGVNSTSN